MSTAKKTTRRGAAPPVTKKRAPEPVTLNDHLERLFDIDDEIVAVQAALSALEEKKRTAQEVLATLMKKDGLESIRVQRGSTSFVRSTVAKIGDWSALTAYIAKHKAFDLFQRRLTSKAYFDRVEAGEAIPGVTTEQVIHMKLNRSKQ